MKAAIAILLILAMATATIQLVTPRHISLQSLEEAEISPVGPGHDVLLKFQRKTENYVWDRVRLINEVDPDWELSTHNDYEYIFYNIRVPPAKASGKYTFYFEISDSVGLRDREIAVVQLFVTHDQDELIEVFPMPERVEGFAGEGFYIPFDIHNKALSQANYELTTTIRELPGIGETHSSQHFLSGQRLEARAKVLVPEEGEYTTSTRIWSRDNPTISRVLTSKIVVKPTFQSKLRSIGRGFPLVPVTMAPFYALLGIFGW